MYYWIDETFKDMVHDTSANANQKSQKNKIAHTVTGSPVVSQDPRQFLQ